MPQRVSKICAACAEVAMFRGHIEPHRYMRIQNQQACRTGGYDTFYHCLECDTTWICHTDQWGFNGGFKLKPD